MVDVDNKFRIMEFPDGMIEDPRYLRLLNDIQQILEATATVGEVPARLSEHSDCRTSHQCLLECEKGAL